MKRRQETDDSMKVERAPFDLQLPEQINTAPTWKVDLPRNKQALIYEYITDKWAGNRGGTAGELVKGTTYSVYVVSAKTGSTQSSNARLGHYYNAKTDYEFLHQVKHYLTDLAHHLSAKKTTIKKVHVEDVEEVEDDE